MTLEITRTHYGNFLVSF